MSLQMNTTKNNLCIIPARGGSKRISKKNIKFFSGFPIIAYSVRAAIESNLFEEVMVSTDDQEIAEIAMKYGAKVPFFRSEKASDDFATTLDVIKEVAHEYRETGRYFQNFCCLYATAPFVTPDKLKNAFQVLISNNYDSVLPVMRFSFPIQRAFEMNSDFKLKYQYEEFRDLRSQDFKECFHDAGQFYWMKKSILDTDSIITNNTGAIEISNLEGQDIDDETDWKLAELKYKLLQSYR